MASKVGLPSFLENVDDDNGVEMMLVEVVAMGMMPCPFSYYLGHYRVYRHELAQEQQLVVEMDLLAP